jgi:hypothetical protein
VKQPHDKLISFDLNFVTPDIILQVVLYVDMTLIASSPDVNMDECQCVFLVRYKIESDHVVLSVFSG